MLKRELEILLKDAELGIKDLEQENANLKARNEALTRFIAATALNLTGEVEPIKKAMADIRAALTSRTDDEGTIQRITEIINAVPKVNPE
ncbi:MAG: hypothetical protein J6P89_02230 [Oscillospiraceae bacterium]|nr:hypothetical protein [Oscillospiraceae bacterium]